MSRQIKTRTRLGVESLEAREVPATLVSPTTVTYQDTDGDSVRVVFSKPILTSANANSIFKFDIGDVNGANILPQQLFAINLNNLPGANGTSVKVTSTAANGGDGFANVGEITADLADLGAVTIDGDLGRFLVGDDKFTDMGLASLRVQSMGKFGTATGSSAPGGLLISSVSGKLGSLYVQDDFKDAVIDMEFYRQGSIGSVFIGGSLIGGDVAGEGSIEALSIGSVKIGGSLIGGSAEATGTIFSLQGSKKFGSISIGKDIVGGTGVLSGAIDAKSGIGSVKVAGDVIAGTQLLSGQINSRTSIGSVTIGGKLAGGVGASAGVGSIKVAGDMPGYVSIRGPLASLSIGGSFNGFASVENAAAIRVAGNMAGTISGSAKSVFVAGNCSGEFTGKDFGTITIAGDFTGRADFKSVQTLSIGGDVRTADGTQGGYLKVGDAANIKIAGDLIGGTGNDSGEIFGGALGNVTIGGSVIGGSAAGDASLYCSGTIQAKRISNLNIRGSLIAGSDNTTGSFESNGSVNVMNDIGKAVIGSMRGNSSHPAVISARGQEKFTETRDIAIGALTINGNIEYAQILGGYRNEPVVNPWNADAQIGTVTVKGDWIATSIAAGVQPGDNGVFGDGDANEGRIFAIKDFSTTSKIGKLTITGQATGTAAAGDSFGIMAQQIGAVKINGKSVALTANRDDIIVGGATDLRVKEVQ